MIYICIFNVNKKKVHRQKPRVFFIFSKVIEVILIPLVQEINPFIINQNLARQETEWNMELTVKGSQSRAKDSYFRQRGGYRILSGVGP